MGPSDPDAPSTAGRPRRRGVLERASWAIAALGSAAILVGALSPDGGLPARARLERDVARIEASNQELRLANAALRARIRAAERDPETLEWQARTQLHFVRDTELVFRLPAGLDVRADDSPQPGR